MWVRGLGWERIPRGLRRRSNRGDSFSPPSVLAAEMMSACDEPPLKTPKNQFPAVASDRAITGHQHEYLEEGGAKLKVNPFRLGASDRATRRAQRGEVRCTPR